MTDYRLKENRRAYFDALYALNLRERIMPGLVYLYLPELRARLGWDDEQALWFAFLNGLTQNPITSLAMFRQLDHVSKPGSGALLRFATWFDENWARLQFDTDRLKNKRGTVAAIESYAQLVRDAGSQAALYIGRSYLQCWDVAAQVHTFGRLSTFSYLEYCHIFGFVPDCDDLMFGDLDGSRSHRNGMLMLLGLDHLVLDKRMPNGVTRYKDLPALAQVLAEQAEAQIGAYPVQDEWRGLPDIGYFTFESALCAFKNSFFGRRFPGCYADMGWERILWAEERWSRMNHTQVFRDIREDCLPAWLRIETQDNALVFKARAQQFVETGFPYRGEFFLEPQA